MSNAGYRSMWRFARQVAIPLVAAGAMSGCILKKPPDASELKAASMPEVKVPPQWTAAGAGSGAVSSNWLAGFKDDQLTALVVEAIAHNPNLQIGAARIATRAM